jgi:hypothetical protein
MPHNYRKQQSLVTLSLARIGFNGAMTLSIMRFRIMAFIIMTHAITHLVYLTLSISTQHLKFRLSVTFSTVMINAFMLNVVMLCVGHQLQGFVFISIERGLSKLFNDILLICY